MSNRYERLRLEERQLLEKMRDGVLSIRRIAKEVGRAASTVHRALKEKHQVKPRLWVKLDIFERAKLLQDRGLARRRSSRKRGYMQNPALRQAVLDLLVQKRWSPGAIAARLSDYLPGQKVSARTIYYYFENERQDLRQYLRHKGVHRRQRVRHRRSAFRKRGVPQKTNIVERPKEAARRSRLGDFEADTVHSRRKSSTSATLTLYERRTRMRWYHKIPNLEAATVLGALRVLLQQAGIPLRTLTLDNGPEFAITEMLKLETFFPGLKVYYCDPYTASQRGGCEHANGDLRTEFQKGTDFNEVSLTQLHNVSERFNQTPMQCLAWRTPEEVCVKLLKKSAA
jgi:transposase, IS30 family